MIPADIERDSEQRRANIAELIDEFRDHLTPGAIVNEVLGPEGGTELLRYAGSLLRQQVRKNPLPIGVIGIGVAWLLLADALRRQRAIPLHDGLDYERYNETSRSSSSWILKGATRVVRTLSDTAARARQFPAVAQGRVDMTTQTYGTNRLADSSNDSAESGSEVRLGGSALSDVKDKNGSGSRAGAIDKAQGALEQTQKFATGLAQSALEKSGEAIGGARDIVGDAASSLMERTNDMAKKTKRVVSSRAANAGSSIGQLAREQPLLVAGVGFALGVALGVLLPLSRTENDLLGEQAEKLKDSASQLANEGYDKVKQVAQRTYNAATETLKDAAEKQGLSKSGEDQSVGSIGSEKQSAPTASAGQNYGTEDGGDTSSTVYRH
jgi:ElaB/YqjD/DUF883 family membrane-anchored ribosome-binding protein